MVSNPGAYILLIGSGVSRSAGIPTGWEVVGALLRRLAVALGETDPKDPFAWYEERFGNAPSYSAVVEQLAAKPAERTGLLAPFFEASADERQQGLKVPTRAHRAIAELVRLGLVRVIVTTNFDRLLEIAVEEAGITPTVVSTDDDLFGIPPLTLVRCLIIKAHGDYRDTRIRNTADEVAALDPMVAERLTALFGEYGIVVSGWSAEFDVGLRAVIESGGAGRFARYWTSRSALGGPAQELAGRIDATVIPIEEADAFFSALVEAAKSLQAMTAKRPLDEAVTVATAKRLLADPSGHISLDELVVAETEETRRVAETPLPTEMTTPEHFRDWLDLLVEGSSGLARLFASAGFYGTVAQVPMLVRSLVRLTSWGITGGIVIAFQARLLPALLATYAAGVAAVASSNYAVLAELLRARVPHTNPRYPGDDDTMPVPLVLTAVSVLDHNAMNGVLNINLEKKTKYYTPASVWLQSMVRELLRDLIPGEAEFERAFDRFEVLLAMRYLEDGGYGLPTGPYGYRGNRAMVGRGVPEQMLAELDRDGPGWPPVAGGVFASVDAARAAFEQLTKRLGQFDYR